MARISSSRGVRGAQPTGDEIATYATYEQAQRAVDHLSDQDFNVKAVTIVGTDLKLVERITGKLNYPRAALSGAVSGAWFGLFVGLLLALVSGGNFLNTLGFALLIGAGFGMLFGVFAYALTGGRRDFTSSSQVIANSFSVLCHTDSAPEARRLLSQLDGGNVTAAKPANPAPTGQDRSEVDAFRRPEDRTSVPAAEHPGEGAASSEAAEAADADTREGPAR